MKRPWPLHPFLLALLPLCITYVLYLGEYPPKEFLLTLGIVLVAVLLLLAICAAVLGSARKGAVLASFFLILFYGYDSSLRFLNRHAPAGYEPGRHRYALPVCFLLLVGVAWWLRRTRKNLGNLTRILNVVFACALLIPSAQAAFYHLRIRGGAAAGQAPAAAVPQATRHPSPAPDIYYIVLDRYGSQETLAKYGCDNAEFVEALRRRGFYVATASWSNYLKTAPSLASSLNMEYLDAVGAAAGRNSIDWGPVFERLDDHAAARFLKSQGYSYVHAGSLWWPTERNSYANRNINLLSFPSNLMLLGETTLLQPVADALGIAALDFRRQQWRRIRHQFDELEKLPFQHGPKFVFAHLLVPHDPYVFNPDGSFVPRTELARRSEEQNYCNQAAYTSHRVLQLIDLLLADSKVPPIILLQGDEGPFPVRYRKNERAFDWKQATPDELREKVSILNAYYLPGADAKALFPSISPVNSFRVVFSLYFGTNLPLLTDRTFAHENDRHPYTWFEVTSTVAPD